MLGGRARGRCAAGALGTIVLHVLRGAPVETGFIARWVHRVLFYSFPEWVFTLAYVLFALAVAVTFRLVPPRRRENPSTFR